jgi:hypothetical protein
MTLSARATAWLDSLGVIQRRPRLGDPEMREWLASRNLPVWRSILAVEARYGGLGSPETYGREITFGVESWFGREHTIDGRRHLLVAAYWPISWFMDEAGRVVEIDDLAEQFYASDSIEHRIEQLAVFERFDDNARLEGFHGKTLANAFSLERLDEACDSRQRIWAGPDLMVRESLEPPGYGKRGLVQLTWVSADTKARIQQAVALARP